MKDYGVGPAWAGFAPADKQALISAFGCLSAASYPHNFDRFSGERFEVGPVQQRGADKVVISTIVPTHGDPTSPSYRTRQIADGWKASTSTTARSANSPPAAGLRRADGERRGEGPAGALGTLTAKLLG